MLERDTRLEPSRAWTELQRPSPHRIKIIKRGGPRDVLFWRELWEYRDLLYLLIWRDIKVRGKQTLLGVAWIILQPVLTTLLFTLIFGVLVRVPSNGVPYTLFALAGLAPWNFFSSAISRGSASLVSSAHLISKVYFPRLLIPLASVLSGLIDLLIVLALLIVLLQYSGFALTPSLLAFPVFLLLVTVAALGATLWLSASNARYRDVGYAVPFLLQFGLFATPVVYPSSLIPQQWRLLYVLNPMVGIVEGFRWMFFGGDLPVQALAVSFLSAAVILISGLYVFRRMERTLADVV